MKNILDGFYEYQIDSKGRIRIPSKLRANLGDDFIAYRGANGCVVISTSDAFQEVYESIKVSSLARGKKLDALRYIMSSTFKLEEDGQGRVTLPLNVRNDKAYGFKKDIVFIGMIDRIELWSKESWEKYNQDNNKSYDECLADLFE